MVYNKLQALMANVAAIEMAVRLKAAGKLATDSEKETLAKYAGFGGIKEVLNIGTDRPVPEEMREPFERLQLALQASSECSGVPYDKQLDSVKSSVLTAFYTPQFIINALARQIQETFNAHGLKMKSFLEPSAGIGGFLSVALPTAERYAFEKDCVTGLILERLHPEAQVITDGFETIGRQDLQHKTFDVIASNIPFGTFGVFDADFAKTDREHERAMRTIHDYFFIKALDILNEGGLLAFLTTRGIADTQGNKFVREYLVRHANLISALRLPDSLFMRTGGIEVGTDLLVFQKNSRKPSQSQREQQFLQLVKETDGAGHTTEPMNRLFTLPKTVLATKGTIQQNQYGKYARKYQWQGTEKTLSAYLADILRTDFGRNFKAQLFLSQGKPTVCPQPTLFDLFGEEFAPMQGQPKPNRDKRPYTDEMKPWYKRGAMVLFEGQLGTLKGNLFVPMKAKSLDNERAKDYLPIRDTYFELANTESDTHTEQPRLRERLNTLYDKFVAKWGMLHSNETKAFILSDNLGMEVLTIEMLVEGKAVKSDVMREPVAFKKIDLSVTLTPSEALASSLNYYGRVNMGYLTQATRQDEAAIIEALQDEMYSKKQLRTAESEKRLRSDCSVRSGTMYSPPATSIR